jgi:hypothetical protein
MKVPQFSFKWEPLWILVFSLAPAVFGFLIALFVFFVLKRVR